MKFDLLTSDQEIELAILVKILNFLAVFLSV